LRQLSRGYAGSGLQPRSILVTANSCAWPRYSADGHYILNITVRPSAVIGD
jgi:hypothetical protein